MRAARADLLAGRERAPRDPTIGETIGQYANVRVCEAANGAGVYEAVLSTLVAA